MIRAGIYVRVSTREQAEEGYSVGAQLDKLRLYCASRDWIVAKEYVDAGYTGSNMDRPGMRDLIRDVGHKALDMVAVYKLDRLSRSQKDTLYLIEDVFRPAKIGFISMQENFDTSTPFGIATVGILSVFAQLERSQIAERMMLGKTARAESGQYLNHARPPIGYEYDPAEGRLKVIEYEAMQVKKIYDLFVREGLSIWKIGEIMRASYTTRYGGYTSAADTVRKILSNPVYTGRFTYGGKIYQSNHEQIINRETFDLAQKRMQETKRQNAARGKGKPFASTTLLGGLLWCAACGARFGGDTQQHSYKGKRYKKQLYVCYTRKKNPRMMRAESCDMRYVSREELDAFVWDEILSLSLRIRQSDEITPPDNGAEERQILAKEMEDVDKRIMRLMDLYSVGSVPSDLLAVKMDDLNKEREKLADQLDALEEKQAPDLKEMEEKLLTAKDIKEKGTLAEQRSLVFALIERITIDQDTIRIKYRF